MPMTAADRGHWLKAGELGRSPWPNRSWTFSKRAPMPRTSVRCNSCCRPNARNHWRFQPSRATRAARTRVPSGRVSTFTNTCSGASQAPRAVPAPSIARSTEYVPCCCSTRRPMTGRRSSTGRRTFPPSRAHSSRLCPSPGTARSRCVRPALAGGLVRSWSVRRNACARSGAGCRRSVHDR